MSAERSEDDLLKGLTPDQVAALQENRRRARAENDGKPRKRLAPDGSWRQVNGDAEVIPLHAFRPRSSLSAELAAEIAQDPDGWAARADALIAASDKEAAEVAAEVRRANQFASYLRRRNPKYASASFEALRPAQRHGGKVQRWWGSKVRSLLMTGLARTGKTTAAYAIANQAHAAGAWVEVFTEIDLNTQLRGEQADAAWARAIGCDLLFIDDWGKVRATDWWKERLHELFDARMAGAARGQRLLVTANTPSSEKDAYGQLVDRYGDPIVERVIDGGGILIFDGPRIRELVESW
jgi:DNA replication protein DnaC